MNHRFRWACLLGIAGIVFLAPIWILWCPRAESLRYHSYRTLVYHQIARRLTQGYSSREQRVDRLAKYVQDHMWVTGATGTYDAKPLEYLVQGTGWCDYQARAFKDLLAVSGIPARYAMLMSGSDVSSHTVSEVWDGTRWGVYDTLFGLRLSDSQGFPLTLEMLSARPSLLDEQHLMVVWKRELPAQARFVKELYARVFPMSFTPRRSIPRTKRVSPFDKILMVFAQLGGQRFVSWYQDCYLQVAGSAHPATPVEQLRLARHMDLVGRVERARTMYRTLTLEPSVASESRMWLGLLELESDVDPLSARQTFETLIVQEPRSPLVPVAQYWIGRCEEALGHRDDARGWYLQAAQQNVYAAWRQLAHMNAYGSTGTLAQHDEAMQPHEEELRL